MATPVIVSRVRATLHKQGYQGFSQQQILEMAESLGIDINNPSPEDTKNVAKEIINLQAIKSIEPANNHNSDDTEIINYVADDSELEINHDMLGTLPKPEFVNKTDLVLKQAELLSISISTQDAELIASSIKNSDVKSQIEAIKQALLDFIAHVEQSNTNSINSLISDVYSEFNASNGRTNELLSTTFTKLTSDVDRANNDFKSSVEQFINILSIN